MDREQILIVDDEELLLELYVAELGGEFDISTATSGAAALNMLSKSSNIAVFIADMHMPHMSGIELLQLVQESSPHIVRIMMTADIDQGIAVDAVNCGSVFRFLNKPCPLDRLRSAIRAGLEQHRLRCAETRMLASTVSGSVNLMGQILAIVCPQAFGRAQRVTRVVEELCRRLDVADEWELGMAATLSQLGCIALPDSLIQQVALHGALSPQDAESWRTHPQLGHDLISKIPRLERVADIVRLQHESYVSAATDSVAERNSVAWRAACLATALEFDCKIERQELPHNALDSLLAESRYPADVLAALGEVVAESSRQGARMVMLSELRAGMVLAEDLVDDTGRLLLTKGQQIADWLIARLRRLADERGIHQPIEVLDRHAPLELPPARHNEFARHAFVRGSVV
jgi:CheY-like chemotaxis protein